MLIFYNGGSGAIRQCVERGLVAPQNAFADMAKWDATSKINKRFVWTVSVALPDPTQFIMPGVQPVSLGERLQFQAGLPMQPRRGQKPLDIGFWDPMRDLLVLF